MKAYYENRKNSPGSFSYKKFSEIGLNSSPNFAKLVIDGQRNLTIENIHKFAFGMGLSSIEQDYFTAMVLFKQEEDDLCKAYYQRKMNESNPKYSYDTKSPVAFKTANSSVWDKTVTLEIISFANGRQREEVKGEAGRKLSATLEQIENVLDTALSDGILEVHDGLFKLISSKLFISDKWKGQLARRYTHSHLENAKSAVDEFYDKPTGKFTTIVFSIKDAKSLVSRIQHLYDLITNDFLVHDDVGNEKFDSFARMSFQIYPVVYDKETFK